MSKSVRITQETFDAAVIENIEVLEMSPNEAVAEAIQQFEAQVMILYFCVEFCVHACTRFTFSQNPLHTKIL